ncbi:MAG: LacI family DNA-binding transcriptional regulator [Pseudomonadota bacterium]
MPNIREVAKAAGVSITTVSRVMNNHPAVNPELRDRVLAEVNRTRYTGARGKQDVVNLGLVYLAEASAADMLNSPFDVALLQGLAQGMDERGYNLVILNARRERRANETFTQMFHRRGIRAAVLRGASRDRRVCEEIAAEGFPVIAIAERFDEASGVGYVRSNSRPTSQQAVSRLIELGHRRIAICLHQVADDDHLDRYEAYAAALEQAGIELDPTLVIRTSAVRDSGTQLIQRVSAMAEPPTAIFITDPVVGVAALHEALRQGIRVPEDLSILGFDDAQTRLETYPPMAAVCQDTRLIGSTAASAVLDLLDDPDAEPKQCVLDTWLELHPSVGPAPEK